MGFSEWLLSLVTVLSKFIHVACTSILLFWPYNIPLHRYVTIAICSNILPIINNSAVRIHKHVLCRHIFSIFLSYTNSEEQRGNMGTKCSFRKMRDTEHPYAWYLVPVSFPFQGGCSQKMKTCKLLIKLILWLVRWLPCSPKSDVSHTWRMCQALGSLMTNAPLFLWL